VQLGALLVVELVAVDQRDADLGALGKIRRLVEDQPSGSDLCLERLEETHPSWGEPATVLHPVPIALDPFEEARPP